MTIKKSIDIFSQTNPGFCALILFSFIKAYEEESKAQISFPLLLIPIPLVLSNDLNDSFQHTNKRTGFFSWLEKNPKIKFKINNRIENSLDYIKQAIEYGFYKGIFKINDDGNVCIDKDSVDTYYSNKITKPFYRKSQLLGLWMGQIDSPKTIFNLLDISL